MFAFLFRNDSKILNVLKFRTTLAETLRIQDQSRFEISKNFNHRITFEGFRIFHHIFERMQGILERITDHASPSSVYAASISEYLTILYQSFINFMDRITARFTAIKSCSPQLSGISVVSNDNRTFSRFS